MDKCKLIKKNLYFLIVSIIVVTFIFYFVLPLSHRNIYISPEHDITLNERLSVFSVSAPVLAVYAICSLKMFKKLKYFNFLNYPLMILNGALLFIVTFSSITEYGLWILFVVLIYFFLKFLSSPFIISLIFPPFSSLNETFGDRISMMPYFLLILPLALIIIKVLISDIKSWKEYIKSKKE